MPDSDETLSTALTSEMSEVWDHLEAPADQPEGRDERGRFKAEEPAEEPAQAEQTEQTEETEQPDQPEAAEPEAPRAPISAPVSWSDEEKAEFGKLPPELQAVVLRRESERDRAFNLKTQEIAAEKAKYAEIDRLLEPHRQEMRLAGLSDAQGLQRLMAAHEALKTNPARAIQWICNEYGIDLQALTADQPAADPQAQHLTRAFQSLAQKVETIEQRAQREAEEATQQRIQAFASDPAHQHFALVRTDMAALLQAGRATDLKDAYEKACWANPEVRAIIQAEQAAELARKAEEERKARLATARKAAGTPPPRSAGTEAPKPRTLGEELAAQWDLQTAS